MLEKMWGRAVAAGNAPFQFAPAEGTAFFAPHGWREAEFRSTWEEALRLKRTMRLAWLWQLIGRLYPKRKRERSEEDNAELQAPWKLVFRLLPEKKTNSSFGAAAGRRIDLLCWRR